MKHFRNRWIILSLFLSLILSACSTFSPSFKETITDWAPNLEIYGTDRVFQVVSQPSYVKEDIVYQVDGEMELALLAKILFDQGTVQFYIQDGDLSIAKTYAYLDALMIHAFKFSMGTKTYSQGDKIVRALDYVKIELYNDQIPELTQAMTEFIDQKISSDQTQTQQLKAIHDGLLLATQYDTAVLNLDLTLIVDHTPFEAYGLFINHKAVCSGYSKAFMGLAQQLNIPVIVVSSTNMNHAWNLVYTGSQWRYVDVTYDDPIPDKAGRVISTYFLLDSKTIRTETTTIKAHTFDVASDSTLSEQDYLDFVAFLFPSTLD